MISDPVVPRPETRRVAVKVPALVALFWVTKALTTAFGESTSDWSVHAVAAQAAVVAGFVAFCVALGIQLRAATYSPWRYWLAVSMVGVFGTMAADVLHVGLGLPYQASGVLFAVTLGVVFAVWYRVEGTLSVHAITTRRRELFYWAAVVTTFALGTAVGDLTAIVFRLGYADSAVLFAGLICLPALAYRFGRLSGVAAFWTAYVLTRPLGASVADWFGKSRHDGGLGVGSGTTALVLGALIIASVGYLAMTKADAPTTAGDARRRPAPRPVSSEAVLPDLG
ncbi:MAG: COG4705 family protein [Jatrophihabitans sp.]|uniref:COG4705 family protein n=1 Tax=Jatrophihabitans sp. TaxID=1932789 RepID=UPI003F8178B8